MMSNEKRMDDPYAPILRNWIFPLAQRLRGRNYLASLKSGRENLKLDDESLQSQRLQKLKALLQHAYETVPFYRRSFNQIGLEPEDIQHLDVLEHIPVLTKSQIKADPESFMSSRPRSRPQPFKTSGSSGIPLKFHQDQSTITASLVCRTRALEAWGVKQGERYLKFHGGGLDPRLFPGLNTTIKSHILAPIEDMVMNRRFASAFTMTPAKLDSYCRMLQKFKPRYIFGYPAAIELLAQHILERDYNGRGLGLKLVVCMGEILYEGQRQDFELAFDCPVAEEYGAAEVGVMAYSYPCSEIHIMDDYLILEVLKSKPSDDFGEVVVTHLENWASPLIRYNLQDLAAPMHNDTVCPAGIAFSRLQKIIGRQFDMIRLPGGEIVHGMYFDAVMRNIAGVTRYKVTQLVEGDFLFTLLLESEEFLPVVKGEIQARMARRFGIHDVKVVSVPEIVPEASGKFRYVTSEIR